MVISVKSVASVDDAINHINIHSTGHSEAIISNNQKNIDKFTTKEDSGCVTILIAK